MAVYTGTPSTVAAGQSILAALWNADVRDPVAALSGAWNSYTPTLSGFTAGSGTIVGRYIQVGKLVIFRAEWTYGSGSAAATTVPGLTLPVTANVSSPTIAGSFQGLLYDTSAGAPYLGVASLVSASVVGVGVLSTNGLRSNASTTSPFTWATGDRVIVSGTYEAA